MVENPGTVQGTTKTGVKWVSGESTLPSITILGRPDRNGTRQVVDLTKQVYGCHRIQDSHLEVQESARQDPYL